MAKTIQQFRHEARDVLAEAREALRLQTEATGQVYHLLNGTIETLLAGRTGFSQAEQVQMLADAKQTALANAEAVAEAVSAAKAEVLAAMDAWPDFAAVLTEVSNLLGQAQEVAASRDFEAHQSEKHSQEFAEHFDSQFAEDEEG